jgi:segregation and condensation protein B
MEELETAAAEDPKEDGLKPEQEQRGLEVADAEAVWTEEGGGPSAAEEERIEEAVEEAAGEAEAEAVWTEEGGGPSAAEIAQESSSVSVEDLLGPTEDTAPAAVEDAQLRAVLEAIVYVAEEPLTPSQLASALQQPVERIRELMGQIAAEFDKPEHGVTVREVAGGYKMATKPEHHEGVRAFVKSLKPPLKLSLPALETLAVIAYKQPVTGPEIMEIRGVQGAGVLKTLLDRKLIAQAGRKNVIGKPILFKTTKEFLIQFGLKDLSELPSLKEFDEIRRMALLDVELPARSPAATEPAAEEAAAKPAESSSTPQEPEPPQEQ